MDIWLNKIMGCESPRCRRCKCRDSLPLMKVSHWIFPRRQTGYRFRHESEDLREWIDFLCTRAMGKEFCYVTQKNGCGSILYCRSFFVLGGKNVQPENNMTLTKAEKQLIEVIRALDYGEVRVMIKDKKPIRVEEIRRSIQLPNEK